MPLHSFILSQVGDSDLTWRQPILHTLEKDRGSFFLAVADLCMCMVRHVQPLCHAAVNIGGKADIPLSVFFSLLWNYLVQVAFNLILIIYCATCMVCYWLTVYIGFILNMCILNGCILCRVGLCDKVLMRLQAAASMKVGGEEVKQDC